MEQDSVREIIGTVLLLSVPIVCVACFFLLNILQDVQLAYYGIYFIYVVGSLSLMKRSKLEWSEFGLSRENISDSLSLSLGFIAAFIVMQTYSQGLHLSTELSPTVVVQELIYCFALSGPAQELVFRGLLFFSIMRWRGWKTALVVSSVLFGFVHVLKGAHYVIATTLIGFVYGYITYRTRNIVGPIVAHSLNNFILGFVLVA